MPASTLADTTYTQLTLPTTTAVPIVAIAVCATVLTALTAAAFIHVLVFIVMLVSPF
jgi:hypothetical protein